MMVNMKTRISFLSNHSTTSAILYIPKNMTKTQLINRIKDEAKRKGVVLDKLSIPELKKWADDLFQYGRTDEYAADFNGVIVDLFSIIVTEVSEDTTYFRLDPKTFSVDLQEETEITSGESTIYKATDEDKKRIKEIEEREKSCII